MMARMSLILGAVLISVVLLPNCRAWVLTPGQQTSRWYHWSSALSAKGGGSKKAPSALFLEVEADGSDTWKCDRVVEIIKSGGVGVLPTDTSYAFVTSLSSKAGVERILRIKHEERCKKPLSILCADIASIDKYTYGIDRTFFKVLNKNLPGPYTFILPASSELPKMLFVDGKGAKKTKKRTTVGCRIPNDPVALSILNQLESPLLVSSVPNDGNMVSQEDDEACEISEDAWNIGGPDDTMLCMNTASTSWFRSVDFVVEAGERPEGGGTIFDLTEPDEGPLLVRKGMGSTELLF